MCLTIFVNKRAITELKLIGADRILIPAEGNVSLDIMVLENF